MQIRICAVHHVVVMAVIVFLGGCRPPKKNENMAVREIQRDTIVPPRQGDGLECELAEETRYRTVWICSRYDDRHRLVHRYLFKASRDGRTDTVNMVKRVYSGNHLIHETANREFIDERDPVFGSSITVEGKRTTWFYYNEFDSVLKKITVTTADSKTTWKTDLFYFNSQRIRARMTSRDSTIRTDDRGYFINDDQFVYDGKGRISRRTILSTDSDDSTYNREATREFAYFEDGGLRHIKTRETYHLGSESAGNHRVRFTFHPILETTEETFDKGERSPVRIYIKRHSRVHYKPEGKETEFDEIAEWKKYEYDAKRRTVTITEKDVNTDGPHYLHDVVIVDSARKIRKVISLITPTDTSRVKIYDLEDIEHRYPVMEFSKMSKKYGFLSLYRYNVIKKLKGIETHVYYDQLLESDSSVSYTTTSVMGKQLELRKAYYKNGVITKRDTTNLRD